MPFGLKSAGSIYQRLVTKAFRTQLGRNLEAYIDDMVIKSKNPDVEETFANLRRLNIKPKKCAFEVTSGKFLGVIIS